MGASRSTTPLTLAPTSAPTTLVGEAAHRGQTDTVGPRKMQPP